MTERTGLGFDASSVRATAVVAAVALLLAGGWWWTGRSESAATVPRRPAAADRGALGAVPAATPAGGPPAPSSSAAVTAIPSPPGEAGGPAAADGSITVDVRGAVRRPGVQVLPPGSRVLDAVVAAGGLRRGGRYGPVNLARPLLDGEQVLVGRGDLGPYPSGGAGPSAATSAPVAPIDLNSADTAALEALDGVGPVLAARIVAWRQQNGRFASVDDLLDVDGIGEQTVAGLRDSVTVG